jgi:hypothetical protein
VAGIALGFVFDFVEEFFQKKLFCFGGSERLYGLYIPSEVRLFCTDYGGEIMIIVGNGVVR